MPFALPQSPLPLPHPHSSRFSEKIGTRRRYFPGTPVTLSPHLPGLPSLLSADDLSCSECWFPLDLHQIPLLFACSNNSLPSPFFLTHQFDLFCSVILISLSLEKSVPGSPSRDPILSVPFIVKAGGVQYPPAAAPLEPVPRAATSGRHPAPSCP